MTLTKRLEICQSSRNTDYNLCVMYDHLAVQLSDSYALKFGFERLYLLHSSIKYITWFTIKNITCNYYIAENGSNGAETFDRYVM